MSKPKIRFNGFTEDWEQRKLGEVADIIGGGTPALARVKMSIGMVILIGMLRQKLQIRFMLIQAKEKSQKRDLTIVQQSCCQ